MDSFRIMFNKAVNWVYPPKCILCDSLLNVDSGETFCQNCYGKVRPVDEDICEKCGTPSKYTELDENFICEDCNNNRIFSFERNISVFEYDEYMREIMHKIKYGKNSYFAEKLGGYLSGVILNDNMGVKNYLSGFDCLMPVPIHKNRLRSRGFNQSSVMGLRAAEALNIPMRADLASRIADTPPQSLLDPKDRANNVRNAFYADESKIMGKAIIIFDDIFTTGSTVGSIARLLVKNGAARIASLTVCGAFKNQ